MGTVVDDVKAERTSSSIRRFILPELPPLSNAKHFTIPSLDGFRALAILLVLVSHCGFGSIVPGGLGVTIFFFLSGYLITTLLRREWSETGTIDLLAFYTRRCLRLMPPLYIVIAVSVAVAVTTGQSFTTGGLLANLFYFTNYYAIFRGDGVLPGMDVLWSLAVEEHFYFLFPVLFMVTARMTRSRQASIIATICMIVLIWRCTLVFGFHSSESRTYLATDTRLDSILWGCLYAVLFNPALNDRMADRLCTWPAAVIGLATLGFCLVYRAESFRETFRYSLQGLALFPIFTVAIRRWNWPLISALNSYPMRLIGAYSYTIYLTHFALIHYLMSTGYASRFSTLFLTSGISFILAALMYQWVDLPCNRLRRRFRGSRVSGDRNR